MKFIVDAQLPIRLSNFLEESGYDTVHTSELINGNSTTDQEIIELSLLESRIVISKDADFYNQYLFRSEPYKLILISVGNVSNSKLMELMEKNFLKISEEIVLNNVVEISATSIITIL